MHRVTMIALAGAMLVVPTIASAVPFTGTYSISAFNETPGNLGLDISTADIAPQPFTIDLATVGASATIDLFRIWTDEAAFNFGDDPSSKPITAAFSFSEPAPPFGGPVGGSTQGATIIIASSGAVNWADPIDVAFGALGDGILRIDLSDEIFNAGLGLGLTPGQAHGATVEATFTLVREASAVPEPATLALLSAGVIGLGFTVRRRRQTA